MKVRRIVFPGDLAYWSRIRHLLTELQARCVSTYCELQEVILRHQEIYDIAASNPTHTVSRGPLRKCVFYPLYRYLNEEADESEKRQFIGQTLPTILQYALLISSNVPKDGLCIVEQQIVRCVELPRVTVASILSCAFLCLFPERSPHSTTMNTINFTHFFQSLSSPIQYSKLRSILHYFDRLSQPDFSLSGAVIFTRQKMSWEALPDLNTWQSCDAVLCPLVINQHGCPHEAAAMLDQEPLEINYRSDFSGGDTLVQGSDMDEIRLSTSPELLASLLFMEKLVANESLLIRGTEQFSQLTHHGSYDFRDTTKRDICGNLESAVCMIGEDRAGLPLTRQETVLSFLNRTLVGFRFCEESRVHGRSSTVMRPEYSVDDDEFFSATESPNRSECESPVSGYLSLLSSLIMSEALENANHLITHNMEKHPDHKTTTYADYDAEKHMDSHPQKHMDHDITCDEAHPSDICDSSSRDGALLDSAAPVVADVFLLHSNRENSEGDGLHRLQVENASRQAAIGDAQDMAVSEDETAMLLNGFATSLAGDVLDQVVSLVINRESGLLPNDRKNGCKKCRLKRDQSLNSESVNMAAIQRSLTHSTHNIPHYDVETQQGNYFCNCSANETVQSPYVEYARSVSSSIISSAFDKYAEIEARLNLHVIAGEFVDTLICGVAQDVINDNFDNDNYEKFCTEIYSSATSEIGDGGIVSGAARRLERESNLDCNCRVSRSDVAQCEACENHAQFNSSSNERTCRRLLNQYVNRNNRGGLNDTEPAELHGSLDWIHESIPEDSELPVDVKPMSKPKIIAKKLFGDAAQELHRTQVLQAGWRRCSEPIYNLTHIRAPLSTISPNRRQTLPVSCNVPKDEDNLASFAQELLAWMNRHEKKLMKLNGSYGYCDELLYSFDEQLKKSSESIPLLEFWEACERGGSRRSSSSGFRDLMLASFEEQLVNTSFDADADMRSKAGSSSPRNRRNFRQTKLSERDFAECCHNFPIESREIQSATQTINPEDICVTCQSPTWDSSSICSYEDACDIMYKELECFASTLTQQIIQFSVADAAAVLRSRTEMGVKSHKRPICCVCSQTHPQLSCLLQWVVASYLGAPSLIYFTSQNPSLYQFDEVRDALKTNGWTVADLMKIIIKFCNSLSPHEDNLPGDMQRDDGDQNEVELCQEEQTTVTQGREADVSVLHDSTEMSDLFLHLLDVAYKK